MDIPTSVVLLDLSMPLLDGMLHYSRWKVNCANVSFAGIGATTEIRAIENSRRAAATGTPVPPARILALTGMSSLDHKKRAFEAGVDG
jgi:CheY-like chemotaxis protein